MVVVHAEQAHDETRRAKTALRAVRLHHRFLRRVQRAISTRNIFNGEQRHAVNRMRQPDAAVDGAKPDGAVVFLAQHDGAGATVAFAAAFLGAGAAQVFAQQVKQCAAGWYIGNRDDFTAPDEADRIGAGCGNGFSGHGHKHRPVA